MAIGKSCNVNKFNQNIRKWDKIVVAKEGMNNHLQDQQMGFLIEKAYKKLKRISHIYEEEIVENVDDCLENKGKDNREEQIDNSNKNPIFQVVNQEENVPTNDQQVIELEKSEEKNCAIPEQEENQKEKEQQVVEIKRENINENNNTPISQVVIQQPAVPSKSIENELIDQILTQNKLESESISFSSNFDTVSQTNVSKIEQCLKARQVPGKLSQIFLRALERKILGVQETKDPKEEQIVQVIDRPVPKVRPRKILQLSEL